MGRVHECRQPTDIIGSDSSRSSGNGGKTGTSDALRGLLVSPEGKGPFPSVVLLHGCDGVQPFQEQWADDLAALGYVTLLVDSHGRSGIGDDCHNWPPTANTRTFDAYGALRYLRDRPEIDAARIGVLGWDTGGRAAIAVLEVNGVQQLVPDRFTAGVAFYPTARPRPPVTAPPWS